MPQPTPNTTINEIKSTNVLIDSANEKITLGSGNAIKLQGGATDNFLTMGSKGDFGDEGTGTAGIIIGMDGTNPQAEFVKSSTDYFIFDDGVDIKTAKFELDAVRKVEAKFLSGGMKRRLLMAKALVHQPPIVFLDEPTAGINPTLINGIIDILITVNKEFGITLLVIEHNMKVIMQLAEDIFCLAHWKMLANGSPDEIKNDKRVIDAYLGAQ